MHGNKHDVPGRAVARAQPRASPNPTLQHGSRTGPARRHTDQQHGLLSGLRIPPAGAFRQRRARPHLRGDRQAVGPRPDRQSGHPQELVRSGRCADRDRRGAVSGAAGGRRGGDHQCRGLRPRRARPLPAARADRARRGCRQRRVSPGSRRSGARADRTGGKKAVRPRDDRANGGRVSRVRDCTDERDPQRRGGFQAQRQNRRRRHGVCRSRPQAGRAAPFRSCRPRRQAVDGQDGARHQHRVLRSAKLPARGCPRVAQGRRGRGGRRLLLARNVGGATRHPDTRRGVRCLLRPHPARRCQP